MINYAIYDCFSTTYLIRPVLEKWTFKQLKDTNIVDLFTSFKSLPLPTIHSSHKKNKKLKKNINLQKLFNINDDDLQPISDDEIYLNQLIEPVSNKQPDYEEISNDEPEANDRIQVNNMVLIINEENEFILDDNERNKPPEDVKEKP
ncbi:unnamed protein product, partial [Rotaria sp. Silwood1]